MVSRPTPACMPRPRAAGFTFISSVPPPAPPGGSPFLWQPRPSVGAAAFTFIELIVVMGVLAMLMGLTVGYLKGAGRVSGLQLARNQILDAAHRAQAMSRGEKLTVVTLRETHDLERRGHEIFTMIAESVLTHSFETLDGASRNLPIRSPGTVKIVPGGNPGSCAQFGRGGALEFEPQASFAMTDGLDVEMWVIPEGGANVMTMLEGRGAYEVSLVRGSTGDYDLRLRVNLRPPDGGDGEPSWASFETEKSPVRATGRWTHVHVRYNGSDASLEVDGLEYVKRGTSTTPTRTGTARRLAVPPEGAVALSVGSSAQSYVGKMDGLVVRGVFRLREDRNLLPEGVTIQVLQPAKQQLPFRLHYVNGRLDPQRHPEDVKIAFLDEARPDDRPMVFSAGRHGAIRADFERFTPPAGGPAQAAPGDGGAK